MYKRENDNEMQRVSTLHSFAVHAYYFFKLILSSSYG